MHSDRRVGERGTTDGGKNPRCIFVGGPKILTCEVESCAPLFVSPCFFFNQSFFWSRSKIESRVYESGPVGRLDNLTPSMKGSVHSRNICSTSSCCFLQAIVVAVVAVVLVSTAVAVVAIAIVALTGGPSISRRLSSSTSRRTMTSSSSQQS